MDNVLVIDYGSHNVKAGTVNNFPNEKEPAIITPSAALYDEAIISSEAGQQSRPVVENAKIVDFDGFEALLFYIMYDLSGWELGDEGSLAFAEPLLTPKADREQLTQLCFEVFNSPGLFIQDSAALSLYALGKLSGCVVDLGAGKIDIAAVTDGTPFAPGIRRLEYTCKDLNSLLGKLMAPLQPSSSGSHTYTPEQLEQLKEQCAKAAESGSDYDTLLTQEVSPETYKLPDGTEVSITTQGYTVAEALFRPSLLGLDSAGVVDAVTDCVASHVDASQRKLVLENMYVCGGGSTIPNLGARIMKELRLQVPPSVLPQMCPTPEYMPLTTSRYAAWIGGAVTAKVVQQQNQFVTKSEYEEAGPYCIHKKCS